MQWTLASAIRIETLEQYLVPSSILYLALPYVIFCMGWLRWPWALLGIGLLTMAFIESTRLAFRHSRSTGYSPDFSPRFTWRHVIILLLTSTTWLSLSGAGGIGYQRGDWMKHESVLKDLIEHTWPVIYDFYQTPVPLVYGPGCDFFVGLSWRKPCDAMVLGSGSQVILLDFAPVRPLLGT